MLVLTKYIPAIEDAQTIKIRLVHDIAMLAKSCQQVSTASIKNCFQHAWRKIDSADYKDKWNQQDPTTIASLTTKLLSNKFKKNRNISGNK